MKIHSSSLRSLPTPLPSGASANKTGAVQGVAVSKDEPLSYTPKTAQTPAEIESILEQVVLPNGQDLPFKDVLNTRVQQALTAYQDQRSQSQQQQRAELIIGIDLYV